VTDLVGSRDMSSFSSRSSIAVKAQFVSDDDYDDDYYYNNNYNYYYYYYDDDDDEQCLRSVSPVTTVESLISHPRTSVMALSSGVALASLRAGPVQQ